jgi:Cns1/TTC4 Wheel domain
LKKLFDKVQARVKVKNEQDRKKKVEAMRLRKERATLYAAIKARSINMRGTAKPPDMEDADIHLTPDPLSPKSTLVFPVILLYPMHNQSDFIKVFAEKDPIIDHLTYIMPLPWDTKGEYSVESVDCYMDTTSDGLVKVGKKKSLLEALSGQKTEVVDGLVRIHVVPQKLAPKWIEEIKKKKGK